MSRVSEWWRRKKIARTLKNAMHGLTLNSVGPLYGVHRIQGESNKSFERRILKAARTIDKTWIFKGGDVQTDIREREDIKEE